jgi:hypothetical protein
MPVGDLVIVRLLVAREELRLSTDYTCRSISFFEGAYPVNRSLNFTTCF